MATFVPAWCWVASLDTFSLLYFSQSIELASVPSRVVDRYKVLQETICLWAKLTTLER